MRFLACAVVLLAGCSESALPGGGGTGSAAPALPPQATLDDAGFLNIGTVPRTPFATEPPPERSTEDDAVAQFARRYGLSRDAAYAAMMSNGPAGLHEEIEALQERLRVSEPGNFVEMRMVREPDVKMEVWFKRDGAATLARYTDNPRFVARAGGLTLAEAEALSNKWFDRFSTAGLSFGGGFGGTDGILDVDVGISEREFDEIAGARGWGDWRSAPIRVHFAAERLPALRADAAHLADTIRSFPRTRQAAGMVLSVAMWGRVELQNGCFRFRSDLDRRDGHLAVFDRTTQLGLDEQGYLAVFDSLGGDRARIGETFVFGGYPEPQASDPDIATLRERCGDAPLVNVGRPQSRTLFDAPGAPLVSDYARRKGLSRQAAWDEMTACFSRQYRESERRAAASRAAKARGEDLPPPILLPPEDCRGFPVNPPPPPPPPPPPAD